MNNRIDKISPEAPDEGAHTPMVSPLFKSFGNFIITSFRYKYYIHQITVKSNI